MKFLVVAIFVLGLLGSPAFSQACEKEGAVEVRLQDENEKNVPDATIEFIDIPEGNSAEDLKFTEYKQSYGSLYVAKFCQTEILRKIEANKDRRKVYAVSIKAEGFYPIKSKVSIYHCFGSCVVNRGFFTVVSRSAKLVTIKGKVKSESASYDHKGRLIRNEKSVAGASIRLKRGIMTEFFTTSDARGNYEIKVPIGSYSVYSSAAPDCYMCAEYFGSVDAAADTTTLDIMLRFLGEG